MSQLPPDPSLEQLRKQAKDLMTAVRSGDLAAAQRVQAHLPRARALSAEQILQSPVSLTEAQLVIAREYDFPSWPRLKAHVESLSPANEKAIAAFRAAVQARDAQAVRDLLQGSDYLRAEIDSPWFSFDSPAVVFAAGRQDRPTLQVLMDSGADPNARTHWWAGGFSALSLADAETARLLISRGAHIDIHDAAHLGDLDRVRELLAADPSLVHARGGDGQSPLHFASTVEVAALLIQHGADLEFRDIDHGSTPAQAALVERPEVCRYLLSAGAQPDLFMAAALDDPDLARRLLAANPGALSSRVGEPPFVSGNPDAGHIYVYTLKTGESPIALAAMLGHSAALAALLEVASPQQRLEAALMACDEPQARALVQQNPDLIAGLTPTERRLLPEAAWRNRIGTVRLALDLGFPVDAVGSEESTALNRAAVRGFAPLVKLLLTHGADPGIKNAYGGTALSAALWGAVNFRDPSGDYPMTLRLLLATDRPWREVSFPINVPQVDAVIREYLELLAACGSLCAALLLNDAARVTALLAAGADLDAPERPDDITPRDLATRAGRADLLVPGSA